MQWIISCHNLFHDFPRAWESLVNFSYRLTQQQQLLKWIPLKITGANWKHPVFSILVNESFIYVSPFRISVAEFSRPFAVSLSFLSLFPTFLSSSFLNSTKCQGLTVLALTYRTLSGTKQSLSKIPCLSTLPKMIDHTFSKTSTQSHSSLNDFAPNSSYRRFFCKCYNSAPFPWFTRSKSDTCLPLRWTH